MQRYILFSTPTPKVIQEITALLLPKELENKVIAYMPSDGADKENNYKYMPFWEDLARKNSTKFNFVDNSSRGYTEKEKLRESNILLITGGNTFTLLDNIKKNGLDIEIINMTKKDDFIISGFSAGAVILTPTINIINNEWSYGKDTNYVGLTDLTGLNLVDFEVLPHYTDSDKESLKKYADLSEYDVKTISDDSYILIDN